MGCSSIVIIIGYDPWGRPGGGAPITSENGQIMTTVRGNFSHRKEVWL